MLKVWFCVPTGPDSDLGLHQMAEVVVAGSAGGHRASFVGHAEEVDGGVPVADCHHHASVLLSRGVSPALVAERLGHDIKTLMRTYAHVIRSDEDRVRSIVDESLGASAEDWLRTG